MPYVRCETCLQNGQLAKMETRPAIGSGRGPNPVHSVRYFHRGECVRWYDEAVALLATPRPIEQHAKPGKPVK